MCQSLTRARESERGQRHPCTRVVDRSRPLAHDAESEPQAGQFDDFALESHTCGSQLPIFGESCNITTLSGNEVVYLDRVETHEPLRIYLRPGSRVPVHCSASGKMILSQMSPAQRRKLLAHAPLEMYTPNTVTDIELLEEEFKRIRRDGYALDNEEFLPGLVCVAVLVPNETGRSNLLVAAQAPVIRVTPEDALEMLPALQRAAAAIAQVETEGTASSESVAHS